MEIGIVGLPNVGKSTLFNALTGAGIAASNFPFTTIEPNVGIVPLPDERLDKLAQINKSAKIVPDGIRFLDIAGLVKGASQGEGLGNMFLGNIRSVDAIAHVVRCFESDDVVNVMDQVDPLQAMEIIETELLLADLQQAQKALEKTQKTAKGGDKTLKDKCAFLEDIIKKFNDGISARALNVPAEMIQEYQFLTAKPMMYVANTDEKGLPEKFKKVLDEKCKKDNVNYISLCAKMEAEIVELPLDERPSFYQEAGITEPGLNRLARAGKDLLNLACFYTSGPKETRGWLVPHGTKAPKAAGKIHTDIERGFIRAEIYKYKDLIELGSEAKIQEKGLTKLEGKEYEIQEGDVVHFRFSV